MRHVVVTGMPGVGKSSVTRRLAERLGWALRDSDTDIENLFGLTGGDIAGRDGVTALHWLESAVLLGALAADTPSVIAAAGSVIDDARCRAALERRASLIVLVGPPTEVAGTDHRRPIGSDELATLIARREPLWRRHAVAVVDADRPLDAIVNDVLDALPDYSARSE